LHKKSNLLSGRQAADFKAALTTIIDHTDNPRHKSVDLHAFAMGQDLYANAQSLFTKSSKQLATETQVVRTLTVKSKLLIYVIVWSGLLIMIVEVRNPLAGIKVAMEVLADESSVSPENRKILSKVVKEVNLIDSLLSSMLEFARPKPPQFTDVRLNDIIERALRFTPGLIKKEIQVDWDRSIQPSDIRADPDQLNQVLLNLFINAEAAMSDGGTIFIFVSWTDKDVQLCVADNGPGIDQATLDEIFTPFFTTKAKGSGLGPAILLYIHISNLPTRYSRHNCLRKSLTNGRAKMSLGLVVYVLSFRERPRPVVRPRLCQLEAL